VTSNSARVPEPSIAGVPQRAGLVLAGLILVAAVANLNLAVAGIVAQFDRERPAKQIFGSEPWAARLTAPI